ncbi:DUF3971 domain-containing protein [Sulfitobacter sp. S190]|nr:DUF3971 domain-containing protein [Sulfitobacter sp. S190]
MAHGVVNALWSLLVLVVVLLVLGVVWLFDGPRDVPAWMERRIEARLARELPNAQVDFGDVQFLIEEGWKPRLRLRDVSVLSEGGGEIMRFSEAQIAASVAALAEGRLQPAQVSLRGVFATIVRTEDGQFELSGGTTLSGPSRRAENLGSLIKQIDDVLATPVLASLDRATLRGLTLQFIDRRAEKVWTLDGGRIIAERDGDDLSIIADLAVLGDSPGVTTLAANFTSTIGAPEAQFGVTIDGASGADIAQQSPAFAFLDIVRAPISGAVRSGVRANGTLAPLSATLQIGKGVVQPNEQTTPIPFESAHAYMSYDAASGLVQFDELSVVSPWVTGSAEGTATLKGLRSGQLESMVGQFVLSDVTANPANVYATAVDLERVEVDARLTLDPFRLEIGRLDITDRGNTARGFGNLTAQSDGWALAFDARIDAVTPERILELWPLGAKPKTRGWLTDNLLEARIRDADFALRLEPKQKPVSYFAFDFDEATVKFLRDMPPITKGEGTVNLAQNRFVVSVDSGEVETGAGGTVAMEASSFIIPDVSVKPDAPAVVRLRTRSSLTAALWLLDREPIRAMQRSGLTPDLGQGEAVLEGTIGFPLRKGGSPADVTFDVVGRIDNLQSDTLIAGRSLSSDRMTLSANNDGVSLSGAGRLDGLPFDATWRQPIGAGSATSTVRGTARVSPAALQAFDIALPDGTLSGETAAAFTIDLARGQAPRLNLTSQLQGLRLNIPPLGWSKPAGRGGELAMSVTLGSAPQVDSIRLSAAGLSVNGRISLAAGGGLERFRIERLRLGDWLDVPVDLIGQGAGRPPRVVIRGGRLDMRRADFGGGASNSGGSRGGAQQVEINLDRLQITDTIFLSQMRGIFKTGGGLDGPFQARLNDGTQISGRIVPQNGRSAIRVTSQDAGGVFRSAGVLQQAVGGKMNLLLLPVGSGGAFDGRLTVTEVSIKDAPSMAALVNAVSVVGLINEMNGDGIYFDEVEAEFRLTPNRMTLARASAIGASLGLSMDGTFATDTGRINMQGVISPVYLLNGIGQLFSRKGEGLFGFNYTLTGNAKSPDVFVNPLSALAPGPLRDALRGPQTELPAVEGSESTVLPSRQQTRQKRIEPHDRER